MKPPLHYSLSLRLLCLLSLSVFIAGCGGGGNSSNATSTPSAINVNLAGDLSLLNLEDRVSYWFNQSPGSGTWGNQSFIVDWWGHNLEYSNGYILPTSGTITGLDIRNPSSGEKQLQIRNFVFDLPFGYRTLLLSLLVNDISTHLKNSTVWGSYRDDSVHFIDGAYAVDLREGNDTLNFNFKFSQSQFSSGPDPDSVRLVANGHTTLIRGVERFEFSDVGRTFMQIQDSLNKK